MAGLISGKKKDSKPPSGSDVCTSLYVHGTRYTNTAAKFWPTLIDEVLEEFPHCATIELAASIAGTLADS